MGNFINAKITGFVSTAVYLIQFTGNDRMLLIAGFEKESSELGLIKHLIGYFERL